MEELTVTASKKAKEDPVGLVIGLRANSQQLVIKQIKEDSLFASTNLPTGCQLLSINGHNVRNKTAEEAAFWLRRCQAEITLQVQATCASAAKEALDTKVGISLQKNPALGIIRIYQIAQDGLFHQSSLSVGQRVTAIQGTECPSETFDAVQLVKSAEGNVSIVALDIPGLFTVTAHKNDTNSAVGLTFQQPEEEGPISVQHIASNSLFASTPLKVGHRLVTINATPAPDNLFDTDEIIKETEGDLVLEVWEEVAPEPFTKLQPGQVLVEVQKHQPQDKAGLNLLKGPGHVVLISHIDHKGLFANTELQVGMQLISINATKCPSSPVEAAWLIRQATSEIVLVASHTTVTLPKQGSDEIGIALGRAACGMIVVQIEDDSPLAKTDLQVGQKVLSINGVACPPSTHDAITMIRQADPLTIVATALVPALRHPWPDSALVTTLGVKESVDSRVGIRVHKSDLGRIVVSHLDSHGIFSHPNLFVGQPIVTINGFPCPETTKETIQVFRQAVGQIHLVTARSILSTHKETASDALGIGLKALPADYNRDGIPGGIRVFNFLSTTLFPKTGLVQRGQRLVRINNQPCPETVREAIDMLKESTGTVVVEAVDSIPDHTQWPDDCIVSATVNGPVGVVLAESNQGRIVLHRIDPQSALANTDLTTGMVLVSVNGMDGHSSEAKKLLKSNEPITIVAAQTVATVTKTDPADSVGISLGKHRQHGVVIEGTNVKSLFGNSLLKRLQKVVSINDEPCPPSVSDAIALIKAAHKVAIVARDSVDSPWNQTVERFVTAHKESMETRVGLAVMQSEQGRVAISRVEKEGVFADSDLMVGDVVLAIDGVPCPQDTKEAVKLMKAAKGYLTIVVAKTLISVVREAETPIGIELSSTKREGLVVSEIKGNGLFSKTALLKQQRILKINGKDCPLEETEAMNMLQEATGTLTIEAVDRVNPQWTKDCIVTSNAKRTDATSSSGLDFGLSEQGRVVISTVETDGLFGDSGLAKGQVILDINGSGIPKDAREASRVLVLGEEEGDLRIVVAQGVAQAQKETKEVSVGLKLITKSDGVRIHQVVESGLFAETPLANGQRIVSINGQECPSTAAAAAALLQEVEGTVTLIAVDTIVSNPNEIPTMVEAPKVVTMAAGIVPPRNPSEEEKQEITADPTIVTVTAEKATADDMVGVSMKVMDGAVRIAGVSSSGLFARSGLVEGQRVLTINGTQCPSTAKEATEIIKLATGKIIIETENRF